MIEDKEGAASAKIDADGKRQKARDPRPWTRYRLTNPDATRETRDDIAFALWRQRRMDRLRPDHPEDYERFHEDFGIRLEPGQWAIIN